MLLVIVGHAEQLPGLFDKLPILILESGTASADVRAGDGMSLQKPSDLSVFPAHAPSRQLNTDIMNFAAKALKFHQRDLIVLNTLGLALHHHNTG